ncbi:MAG: 16S rRNA (guanine(966)-N(2))-methyltransferase RsmD [Chromatiales bacterium]|nr:16S rRNA (guanine(966)-N(2))-methyltransferase RsmD [Chromatiales bacterium]
MLPKVRIVAGRWRGRKIEFLNLQSLRPTPDRVRETLFNWLAPTISKAHCLDLFAGSGVIGFESLSRSAASVVMVDNNLRVCAKLRQQAARLEAKNIRIVHQEATQFINHTSETFDIVFIDPPFRSELASVLVHTLSKHPILNPQAMLYVEMPIAKQLDITKTEWKVMRSAKTKQVRYFLLGSSL